MLLALWVGCSPNTGRSRQSLDCSPSAGRSRGGEILWDSWGIPHIYAETDERLLFALGWAEMRSHGDRILELYGKARGRAAELWGRDYLDSDRYVRTMGGPRLAREAYARSTRRERTLIDAFAAGMNAYALAHADALDSERRRALPVSGQDVLETVVYSLYLNGLYLGPERVRGVVQSYLATGLGSATPGQVPAAASNGWVLGPAKSRSGRPLLLSNTHLAWPNLPGYENVTWYEAQLVGRDLDLYGVGLIGLPALTFGFNAEKAWTITAMSADFDLVDFYELTLAGEGYRFDGSIRPFETETETLDVRDPDGTLHREELVIERSVHGPIVARTAQKALALKFPCRRTSPGPSFGAWRAPATRRSSWRPSGPRAFRLSTFCMPIGRATSCTR